MPAAEFRGRRVHYERRGAGEPLLLIQGMGGHHASWGEAFVSALEPHFDLVSYDHRGIGESTDVPGPFTIADLAADTVDLLDVLGWGSAHVLAISMGGMVAQELVLSRPDRVRRLVLGCTYAGGAGATLDAPGPAKMIEGMRTGDAEIATRAAFEANLSPAFTADESHFPPFRQMGLAVRVPFEVVLRQAQAVGGHDTSTRLPSVSAPTLVVHGSADQMVLPANGEQIAGLIPEARLHVVDGVGHLFWWERPHESAELIRGHCLG